jgi:hypothetical protein
MSAQALFGKLPAAQGESWCVHLRLVSLTPLCALIRVEVLLFLSS